MGLVDKWFKRKKEVQLAAVEKKAKADETEKDKKADAAVKKEEKQSKQVTAASVLASKVLLRPVVSEKAASFEGRSAYSFFVSPSSDKSQIKQAIKEVYGVYPEKVRVINLEGKIVRFGRQLGKRPSRKKAVVYLPKGQSINIHEGV